MQTKQHIQPLMEWFYDRLSKEGFVSRLHRRANAITRDEFVSEFYNMNSNLNVCPACDGKPPGRIGRKSLSELDHFLPKSDYPFLSIHPLNLVPICMECNDLRVKGDQDPIDNHNNAPMANGFFPYTNAALNSLVVFVSRRQAGQHEITLSEAKIKVSRRVNSLNRLYRLDARWQGEISQIKERVEEHISHWHS